MSVFLLTFQSDNGNVGASNVVVYVGGNYNQNQNNGLFYQNSNSVSNSNANIGSHHLFMFAQQFRFYTGMGSAHLSVKIVPQGNGLVLSAKRAQERSLGNKETALKRVKNLWSELISDDNLKKAIREVCKSHRYLRYPDVPNPTTAWMEDTMDRRVAELRDTLTNGFTPSECKHKRVYDVNASKWRDISEPKLYPDQCIHHALIQVLQPVMMRGMDHWCCGSIKGRGTHYGIKGIKKWMKNPKGMSYCIELDIRHFYDSIKPEMVKNRMLELIKDHNVIDLIERITADGITIGAYCSQWFANTLLQPLDQIIRQSGAVRYVRYMDNFTIFVRRKRTADKIILKVREWLAQHGLELKGNWQKFHIKNRMPNALGYRYGQGFTNVRKKSLLRLKRALKRFYAMWDGRRKIPVKLAQGILSRLAILKHCNSVALRKRIVRNKTEKKLKSIVSTWEKEVKSGWNTSLEQGFAAA